MGLHYDFAEISSGVMVALENGQGGAASNAGIIDLGDKTLIFDSSNSLDSAKELRQAAELWTGRPGTYLVNSHHHGDHINGNPLFADALIISTAETRALMAAQISPRDRSRHHLPALTFDTELEFCGSERRARLITYGGGHTASDSFLFLPEANLIFIADLIFNGYHPYIADGDPGQLLTVLDRVRALGAQRYVPGHGDVCGNEQVVFFQHYLRALTAKVGLMKAAGAPESEVASLPVPDEFAHLMNVGTMYESTLATLYNYYP